MRTTVDASSRTDADGTFAAFVEATELGLRRALVARFGELRGREAAARSGRGAADPARSSSSPRARRRSASS
jgi:hypothetical protein